MRILSASLGCILLGWSVGLPAAQGKAIERLLHGEILFESLQGRQLDALLKLNTGQPVKSGWPASRQSTITDLRLAYGLSTLTDQSVKRRGNNTRNTNAQNRAAYALAWFYYDDGKPTQALQALEMIRGDIDDVSVDDIQYLRALSFARVGKHTAAANLLERLPDTGPLGPYVQYNLAMAQLQSGNEARGRASLAALGQTRASDEEALALKDLANLKLGYRYLEEGRAEQAKASFNRIRLDGPFTNQALLGAGWAAFQMGQIERAVVAWSVLHEKTAINDSVIEAKMALPYAYSKLGAHGKAANLYAKTIELFDAELAGLASSSKAIDNGELRRAIMNAYDRTSDDWFKGIANGSGQRQQFHLPLLLANDGFNRMAGTLHELAVLAHRLQQARKSVDTHLELVYKREKYYGSTLPAVDRELSTVKQRIKSLSTAAAANASDSSPELKQLQSAYDDTVKQRGAALAYSQQLPKHERQLKDLANRLDRVGKKLDAEINRVAKQMESAATQTLALKYKQLESYRSNALFSLAESYDFATGKQE